MNVEQTLQALIDKASAEKQVIVILPADDGSGYNVEVATYDNPESKVFTSLAWIGHGPTIALAISDAYSALTDDIGPF